MHMTPSSKLLYREYSHRPTDLMVSVVPIHSEGGDLDELVPLCAAMDPRCRIVAPQGPLAAPSVSSRPRASVSNEGSGGYGWFEKGGLGDPDPASLAAALIELENFLRDVMERRQPTEFRPILLGHGQGAALAMAMARLFSETLTALVLINGQFPDPGEKAFPDGDLTGLPVLIIHDPRTLNGSRARAKDIQTDLRERGALLDPIEIEGIGDDLRVASKVLREWTDGCLASTFRTDFNWEIGP